MSYPLTTLGGSTQLQTLTGLHPARLAVGQQGVLLAHGNSIPPYDSIELVCTTVGRPTGRATSSKKGVSSAHVFLRILRLAGTCMTGKETDLPQFATAGYDQY